jgi:hypothetical protein
MEQEPAPAMVTVPALVTVQTEDEFDAKVSATGDVDVALSA